MRWAPIVIALAVADFAVALQTPSRAGPPDAIRAFEVATVKRSALDPGLRHFGIQGRRFVTSRTSLADLISFAYGLHARQIINAPNWFESEKFDITGIPEGEGQPTEKEWMAMIANLLADRFHLQFHRDTRTMPIYAIVVARGGPKLIRDYGDNSGLPHIAFRGIGRLVASNANIGDLAWELQSMVLDRPVVDQTGINGRFDFTLAWTPDEFQLKGREADRPPPAVSVGRFPRAICRNS